MGKLDRPSSGALTVSGQLGIWEEILSGRGRGNRFLILLYTVAPVLYPPAVLCVSRRALSSPDVDAVLRSVCGLACIYSSGAAAFLWGFRRQRLARTLARTRQLCQHAEQLVNDEETSRTLSSAAQWLRMVRTKGFIYIKAGSALAAIEQFTGSPAVPVCLEFQGIYPRLMMAVVESVKWGVMATCFFSMCLYIVTVLIAMEVLYKVLCARLRRASGHQQTKACVTFLREIFELEADVRDVFYSALFHMLAGALLVPLINTYQLLVGQRSFFLALTLSTMPQVYGSLSVLGDRLAQGCEQVRQAAYDGPWTEESLSVVRLRTMLMQCCHRSATFAMQFHGGFTRAASYSVLKKWYQYLSLLSSSMNEDA